MRTLKLVCKLLYLITKHESLKLQPTMVKNRYRLDLIHHTLCGRCKKSYLRTYDHKMHPTPSKYTAMREWVPRSKICPYIPSEPLLDYVR